MDADVSAVKRSWQRGQQTWVIADPFARSFVERARVSELRAAHGPSEPTINPTHSLGISWSRARTTSRAGNRSWSTSALAAVLRQHRARRSRAPRQRPERTRRSSANEPLTAFRKQVASSARAHFGAGERQSGYSSGAAAFVIAGRGVEPPGIGDPPQGALAAIFKPQTGADHEILDGA